MTEHDPFGEAAEAMRSLTDGQPDLPDETLARVLGTLAARKRRRVRVTTWVLPIAAVLVGSTGWAAATGRLPAAVRTVVTQIENLSWNRPSPEPAPARRAQSGRPSAGLRVDEADSAPELPRDTPPVADQPAPSAPVLSVEPVPDTEPRPERSANATRAGLKGAVPGAGVDSAGPGRPTKTLPTDVAGSASAVPPPPAVAPVGEFEPLYREAHEAHFVKNDPALALTLWDRYLAARPGGPFELEARYNRAIALLRLGRKADALRALEPFAAGAYGRYRQSEASALVEAAREAGEGP